MLQETDVRGDHMAVTWVDIQPGSKQIPHRHSPQQAYIIVRGTGKMRVGNDTEIVNAGDVVYVPGNVVHGIDNVSSEVLTYITTATPGFDMHALFDTGQANHVSSKSPHEEAAELPLA